MSLINKMLSDLEQRHSHRKEHDEIVIGGLAPVVNTGFAQPRVPYNFLLVCFFIFAVFAAGYGYWNSLSGVNKTAVSSPAPESPPSVAEAAASAIALPALKMDLSLPAVVPVEAETLVNEIPEVIDTVSSVNQIEPELIEPLEVTPAMDQVLAVVESGYGHMEIKPATPGEVRLSQQLLNEARSAYQQRDYNNGDAKMREILRQDPLYVEARTVYAGSLVERGDNMTAMQLLASGLELNSAVAEWAMLYARLLTGQGKLAEAVGVLTKSLPSIENNQDYYALYAALLQKLSRHEEAVNHYRALLQRQPDNGVWWLGMAISLERLQKADEALVAYKRAMQGKTLDNELKQFTGEQIRRLEQ